MKNCSIFLAAWLPSTPLVITSIAQTITERAGVVNLSLDGSIILSAMVGFVAAYA
jgi:simple sugar transport system permease protein